MESTHRRRRGRSGAIQLGLSIAAITAALLTADARLAWAQINLASEIWEGDVQENGDMPLYGRGSAYTENGGWIQITSFLKKPSGPDQLDGQSNDNWSGYVSVDLSGTINVYTAEGGTYTTDSRAYDEYGYDGCALSYIGLQPFLSGWYKAAENDCSFGLSRFLPLCTHPCQGDSMCRGAGGHNYIQGFGFRVKTFFRYCTPDPAVGVDFIPQCSFAEVP